jgi:hypothetical protein
MVPSVLFCILGNIRLVSVRMFIFKQVLSGISLILLINCFFSTQLDKNYLLNNIYVLILYYPIIFTYAPEDAPYCADIGTHLP